MPDQKPSRILGLVLSYFTRPKKRGLAGIVALVIGSLFWLYIIAMFFVGDVVGAAFNSIAPALASYRPLILAGFVICVAVIVGKWRFFKLVLYLLFFPAIVFLRIALPLAFRHWMVVLISVPLVYSSITPIKTQAVVGFLAVVAAITICTSTIPLALIVAMVILFLFLVRHYSRQFKLAFAPARVVAGITSAFETAWASNKEKTFLATIRDAKNLPQDSAEYRTKWWLQGLGTLLWLNDFYRILAVKVRGFQQSQVLLIYSLGPLMFTIALTVAVFALEYSALYTLDSSHFSGETPTGALYFLHFAFATFLTASFGSFAPASNWAHLLTGAELCSTIVVGTMLAFVFTTAIREENRHRLDKLIERLDADARDMEALIQQEYELPLEEAHRKLHEIDPTHVTTIDGLFR